MPTPNVPENTAPSSRGKVASIGVIGNLGGGTAAGSSTNNLNIGGFSNASKGGSVYTGVASSNTFPNNPAITKAGDGGGAGQGPSIGSSNPLSPQAEVATVAAQDKSTTNVAQVSTVQPDSIGFAGYHTDFPVAKDTFEFSKVNGSTSKLTSAASNVDAGIDANRTYAINNDITRMTELKTQVVAAKENNKIDGAAQGANSKDKFVALGDNVQTTSMNTLPGGKDQSQQVGNN